MFLLAPHFGNLNFGMITENIERCHTYHEVSRHLKGYLLLRVKMHVLMHEAFIDTFDIWNDQFKLSMNVLN